MGAGSKAPCWGCWGRNARRARENRATRQRFSPQPAGGNKSQAFWKGSDPAISHGLAQQRQYGAGKFRQPVRKPHAVVGQGNLPRRGHRATLTRSVRAIGWCGARKGRGDASASSNAMAGRIVPYRNPVTTGKMPASVDAFSGGRLILGVGSGWWEDGAWAGFGRPPKKGVGRAPDFNKIRPPYYYLVTYEPLRIITGISK